MSDTLRGLIGLVVILAGLHEPETECPPQLDCLALSVWAESRGEPIEGQIAVAEVVLARGEPCEVIQQPGQFEGVERMPYPREPWKRDPYGWRLALAAAWTAMETDMQTECNGATHFYAHGKVTPAWAGEPCRISEHTFTVAQRRASAEDWTLSADSPKSEGEPIALAD